MSKSPYIINSDIVQKINGDAFTCPMFTSKTEFDFVLSLIENGRMLGDNSSWNPEFGRMVHMSDNSDLFRTKEQLEKLDLICKNDDFF